MSLQARSALVNHPHTLFQRESQRDDLMDPHLTQTDLIALLLELVGKGHIILFTAVRSDHHDDSALGVHSHANGYAADTWPMNSTAPTDYATADSERMTAFLVDAAKSPFLFQIGLAGSADTAKDEIAAGRTVFGDGGEDHCHLGSSNQ